MVLKLLLACSTAVVMSVPNFAYSQCTPDTTARDDARLQRERHEHLAHATVDDLLKEEDFTNEGTAAVQKASWAREMRRRQICAPGLTRAMISPEGKTVYGLNLDSLAEPNESSFGIKPTGSRHTYTTEIEHRHGQRTTVTGTDRGTIVEGYLNRTVGSDVPHREVLRTEFKPEQGDVIVSVDRFDADGTRTRIFSRELGSLLDQANAAHRRTEAAEVTAERAEQARRAAGAQKESAKGASHDRPERDRHPDVRVGEGTVTSHPNK